MSKKRISKPKSEVMKQIEADYFSCMNTIRRNAHAAVCIDGETVILPSIAEMEAESAKKEGDNHEHD